MSQPPSPDAARDEYAALPPDAQQTVAAFVAFLGRQSRTRPKRRTKHRVPLRDDPAIGMWRDRPEMEDSVEYIRTLRFKHWGGALVPCRSVDSDIVIDAFRSVPQAVARLDREEATMTLFLSPVSYLEVLVGCRSKREQGATERFLRRFQSVPVNAAVCERAVDLVRRYHLSHGLLLADALIAATALVSDIPLLTKNQRDFRFIASLRLLPYP